MRAYLTGVTSTSNLVPLRARRAHLLRPQAPDGMRKNQKLEKAILTPSTKAEKGDHDKSSRRARRSWPRARFPPMTSTGGGDVRAGFCLWAGRGRQARPHFGRHQIRDRAPSGRHLVFHREIDTPDSSRYWYADDYQAHFDRKTSRAAGQGYVRRTLADQGYRGDGPPRRRCRTKCASRPRAVTSRFASSSPAGPSCPTRRSPSRAFDAI